MGRALLWWPFTAFVAVAAFPGLAVPGVVVCGALLVVVGLVGAAIGRLRRIRRQRRERMAVTPFAPRAVREALPSPREPRTAPAHAVAADADAEDDQRVELQRHAA